MGEKREIEEIFSKAVRAGRRTYFFDVRSTRAGDYYLTMTESKRDFNEDGTPFYKKHKMDFDSINSRLIQKFVFGGGRNRLLIASPERNLPVISSPL